jgi:putative transposase
MDAGYVGMKITALSRNYNPHIRPRYEEVKAKRKGKKAKRWVVERTLSWINRFRKVLIRYEKKAANHMGLLELVCGMIAWRQIVFIYG